jgi:hypothetical protein
MHKSNWGSNGRPGVRLRRLALAKDFVVSLLSLLRALFAKHLQRAHGWLARCGPFPRIPTPLHRHHHNRLRNAAVSWRPRGHAPSSTAPCPPLHCGVRLMVPGMRRRAAAVVAASTGPKQHVTRQTTKFAAP